MLVPAKTPRVDSKIIGVITKSKQAEGKRKKDTFFAIGVRLFTYLLVNPIIIS